MKKLLLLLVMVVIMTSCTQNQRAKNFGGTATIEIKAGQKLVTATWKGENLWYLTKQMTDDDKVETYYFKEDSSLGFASGTVIFKEKR